MSVNTAHANNGVLIHSGEYILLHSDSVYMEFSGQDNSIFQGQKSGRIYLTSHRMIFNNKKPNDEMQSFSAPFIAMSNVELEQPVFGANYIKGKVRAQPNGNFVGEVKFKLHFKAGGAIEYGQALLRAAGTAQSNLRNGRFSDDPPPYTPSGQWHEAPPPAYQPPPGYYGWLPTHDAFSGPAPNTVFMSDNPPPYPGIGGPAANVPPWQQQGYQPQQPGYQPQQPQPQQQPGYQPQQQQQPGYQPQQQPGYQPQQPQPQQPASGYQPQQWNNDAPSWNGFSVPPPEQPQVGATHPGGQPQMGWGGAQPPPYSAVQGYGAPGAGYGAPGYGGPQQGYMGKQ